MDTSIAAVTQQAIDTARRDGALEARVANLESSVKSIGGKLDLILYGGFTQLAVWGAGLLWWAIQHQGVKP